MSHPTTAAPFDAAPTASQLELFRTMANPAKVRLDEGLRPDDVSAAPRAPTPPARARSPSVASDRPSSRASSRASSRRSRESRSSRGSQRSGRRKGRREAADDGAGGRRPDADRQENLRRAALRARLDEFGGSHLPKYATADDLDAELSERAFQGRLGMVRRYSRTALIFGVGGIEWANRRAGGVLQLDGWSRSVEGEVADECSDALVEIYVDIMGETPPSPYSRLGLALAQSAFAHHMAAPRRAPEQRTAAARGKPPPTARDAPPPRVVAPLACAHAAPIWCTSDGWSSSMGRHARPSWSSN